MKEGASPSASPPSLSRDQVRVCLFQMKNPVLANIGQSLPVVSLTSWKKDIKISSLADVPLSIKIPAVGIITRKEHIGWCFNHPVLVNVLSWRWTQNVPALIQTIPRTWFVYFLPCSLLLRGKNRHPFFSLPNSRNNFLKEFLSLQTNVCFLTIVCFSKWAESEGLSNEKTLFQMKQSI